MSRTASEMSKLNQLFSWLNKPLGYDKTKHNVTKTKNILSEQKTRENIVLRITLHDNPGVNK